MLRFATASIAAVMLAIQPAAADTLGRIAGSGVIKLGYREDAPPFSYKDDVGEPAGYAVEICRAVASGVKGALDLPEIGIEYVPVTAENRFDAVVAGRIDLLCGPTTQTLSRRERVDFSLPTFIDGAGVLFRADGPDSFAELAGRKIGVRSGTTTEEALGNTLKQLQVEAEVVPVESHYDGVEKLQTGEISAYFGDWAILLYLLAGSEDRQDLRLSDRQFTFEAYALAMPRGDTDFRLTVDRTLSRLYRSRDILDIFASAFGSGTEPSDVLQALFVINSLPE